MGTAGESEGPEHWESDYDGEREGACNNQQLDLGRLNSYLQHPSSSPNQRLFAPLQNQVIGTV